MGSIFKVNKDAGKIVTHSIRENAKNDGALLRVGINSGKLNNMLPFSSSAKSARFENDLLVFVVSAPELERCASWFHFRIFYAFELYLQG